MRQLSTTPEKKTRRGLPLVIVSGVAGVLAVLTALGVGIGDPSHNAAKDTKEKAVELSVPLACLEDIRGVVSHDPEAILTVDLSCQGVNKDSRQQINELVQEEGVEDVGNIMGRVLPPLGLAVVTLASGLAAIRVREN